MQTIDIHEKLTTKNVDGSLRVSHTSKCNAATNQRCNRITGVASLRGDAAVRTNGSGFDMTLAEAPATSRLDRRKASFERDYLLGLRESGL